LASSWTHASHRQLDTWNSIYIATLRPVLTPAYKPSNSGFAFHSLVYPGFFNIYLPHFHSAVVSIDCTIHCIVHHATSYPYLLASPWLTRSWCYHTTVRSANARACRQASYWDFISSRWRLHEWTTHAELLEQWFQYFHRL
jgi:hypothetical protein